MPTKLLCRCSSSNNTRDASSNKSRSRERDEGTVYLFGQEAEAFVFELECFSQEWVKGFVCSAKTPQTLDPELKFLASKALTAQQKRSTRSSLLVIYLSFVIHEVRGSRFGFKVTCQQLTRRETGRRESTPEADRHSAGTGRTGMRNKPPTLNPKPYTLKP